MGPQIRTATRPLLMVLLVGIVTTLLSITCGCERSEEEAGDSTVAPSEPNAPETAERPGQDGQATVRILAWVGYDEADFLTKLQEEAGVTVEVKTYLGGDQMYRLFQAAPPGTYDLVVVDREYGEQLFADGAISAISGEHIVTRDLLEPFASKQVASSGSATYAIPLRWGALGLVYNADRVTEAQAQSYDILFDERLKGRVAVFDWYLPNMSVLARYLRVKESWDAGSSFSLTTDQLDSLVAKLRELRVQVRSVQPSTGDLIATLRSGAAWVSPGVGEWAAAALKAEGLPIEWVVPDEGGVMWIEALAITPHGEGKPETLRVVRAFQEPEVLASLMWRKAYVSQSTSRAAYEVLDRDKRRILKADDLGQLESLAQSLEVRSLPGPAPAFASPEQWQAGWQRFKNP